MTQKESVTDKQDPPFIRNRLTGGIAEEKPVNTYDGT